MSTQIIIVLVVGIIFAILGFVVIYFLGSKDESANALSVNNDRQFGKGGDDFPDDRVKPKEFKTSELTLAKKIYYAGIKMPVPLYRGLEVFISIVAVIIASRIFDLPLTVLSLFTGPLVMKVIIKFLMDKKFKKFNKDYAAFLMNLTSLLKTGMDTMTALSEASDNLDDDSLLREEVKLMVERLKFGVEEEKSIGSFAEEIYHPEIELFVQSLILSRKLGGSLADSLDRLSKQVRQRETFRAQAAGAVGMQRGAVWFLLSIMVGLETFIYLTAPELVKGAFSAEDGGWAFTQWAILVMIIGLRWVRTVTNFRI